MTRAQAKALAGVALLIGATLLAGILITDSPPQLSTGEPNTLALVSMLFAMMLMAGGLGTLFALGLHKRWPSLGGATDVQAQVQAAVAFRQGGLLALGVGLILTLQYFQKLDLAYFLVTFLVLILFEAFLQSRE